MITVLIVLGLAGVFLGMHKLISTYGRYKLRIKSKTVLLVTAHPDDECMFFSPTILQLLKRNHNLYLLCLSSGNAYQEGRRRRNELYKSCNILGLSEENVILVENELLQDGQNEKWDMCVIKPIISEYVQKLKIGAIITFDGYGVSGHSNHTAIFHAVKSLMDDELWKSKSSGMEGYSLTSVNIARKYSILLDLPLSFLLEPLVLVNAWKDVGKARLAMMAHASQMVWYRHLYIQFSRYMIFNTLRPLHYIPKKLR